MIRYNKWLCLLGTALSLTLVGCRKDFLETSPSNALSLTAVERELRGGELILNGIHAKLYQHRWGSQTSGAGYSALALRMDLLSDEVINSRSAYHMGFYRWTDHRSREGSLPHEVWTFFYDIIHNANRAIAGLRPFASTDGETARYRQTMGGLLTFRAWAYHHLVQCFGKRYVAGQNNDQLGVPIFETPIVRAEPRRSVEEVYTLIDKDLAEARTLLQGVRSTRKNVIRYPVALAISARVALSKSQWSDAVTYATDAIASSGARLQSGEELTDGFANTNASEWIWGYKPEPDQGQGYFEFGATFSYNFNGHNRGVRLAVNRSLYDKMGERDARRGWWVALDRGNAIPADGAPNYFSGGTTRPAWEVTGQSIKFKANNASDPIMDKLILRLAELYYIKAEAEARAGQEAAAQTTLQTIMLTRDPDYAYSGTGAELLEEIMRNKRLDLWFEGQAFFDLKRSNRLPNRLEAANFEIIRNVLGQAAYNTAQLRNTGQNALNIPTTLDSKHWEFAIPLVEIESNPDIALNPL